MDDDPGSLQIDVACFNTDSPANEEMLCNFLKEVVRKAGCLHWTELSVLFCDDDFIRSLNLQFRNIDSPTDILSFSQGEPGEKGGPAGDLVISVPSYSENVRHYGLEPEEELKRILIHGVLHLKGEVHLSYRFDEPMLAEQEKILKELRNFSIL